MLIWLITPPVKVVSGAPERMSTPPLCRKKAAPGAKVREAPGSTVRELAEMKASPVNERPAARNQLWLARGTKSLVGVTKEYSFS